MDDDRSILKRGAKRTLWLRAVHGRHVDVVVKRYHAPGLFDRWRDAHRAESEMRTLQALFARGLPVPEPLAVERNAAGVDLVMRSIEGARSLAQLLREPDGTASASRITRSIGILLSRASLCGLRHPDLHAGNVLVDGEGEAWLVDLRGARLGGAFDWSEHERALVVLAADVRERTGARDRARVLIASLRFLALAGCTELPRARDVAHRIDAAARQRRRTVLARASRRWMRASSVTQPLEWTTRTGTERGLRARGADEVRCRQALDGADKRPFVAGSARAVERAWRTAARLHEHGIPVAAPLALVRGAHARAVFGTLAEPSEGAGDGLRARDLVDIERDPTLRAAAARSLGTLLGLLSDRGLSLVDPVESSVAFDARGTASVAVGARVRSVDPLQPDPFERRLMEARLMETRLMETRLQEISPDWSSVSDVAARATRTERARFLVAWLRAQQLPMRHRARLRASLRGTRT